MKEPFREGGTRPSWMTKGKYLKYSFLLLKFVERELVVKKLPGDNREFRAQRPANECCPVEVEDGRTIQGWRSEGWSE